MAVGLRLFRWVAAMHRVQVRCDVWSTVAMVTMGITGVKSPCPHTNCQKVTRSIVVNKVVFQGKSQTCDINSVPLETVDLLDYLRRVTCFEFFLHEIKDRHFYMFFRRKSLPHCGRKF